MSADGGLQQAGPAEQAGRVDAASPDGPAPVGTDPSGDGWAGIVDPDQVAVDEPAAVPGLRLPQRARALALRLVLPHRRPAALAAALQIAEILAALAGPLLVAAAIDTGLPAAVAGRPAPLAAILVGYAITGLLAGGLRAWFTALAGRVGQDVLLDLRELVFRHAQRLSLEFHERYTSGRLISRLTSDLEALSDLLEQSIDGLIGAALSMVGIATVMLVLDPLLGLVVLAVFLPIGLLTRWYQRRARAAYRRTRTAVATMIVHLVESLNGIRAVAAYRRERRNEAILGELSGRYAAANVDAFVVSAWYLGALRLLGNVTMVAVLLIGGLRVLGGELELGVLTAFVLYVRRFFDPLDRLSQFLNAYQSGAAALEKLAELLAERPRVAEPVRPVPLPQPVRGELEFDAVRFAYPRAPERMVLPDLALAVPAGQTVALVGATGAGKTTVAKLAARFHDPTSGRVRLDGIDLRDLADDDLRSALVMVTQEAFLFSGSVAENIAWGRPGASRAEIVAAADAVGAREFVEALPDGFDTDVRKRGGRISAGQRQLVSLARIVLADPAVVLLDEATSSLDVPSERAVQDALRTVLAGRTALIIAHRLSTVEIADRVLVMSDGRVIQDGTPDELIGAGGQFADLHTAWRESLV